MGPNLNAAYGFTGSTGPAGIRGKVLHFRAGLRISRNFLKQ